MPTVSQGGRLDVVVQGNGSEPEIGEVVEPAGRLGVERRLDGRHQPRLPQALQGAVDAGSSLETGELRQDGGVHERERRDEHQSAPIPRSGPQPGKRFFRVLPM